ncbi:alpha/beta hydrolase family protein [Roseateles aquatilis]|uniref:alpha/beta hydrolase family protein n=1 Tax=Roseateles aquatilis TaxID=431061 RepID=UPI00130374D8|nr:alpha/beta hydrolase [Roseateles aquatilis]
MKSLVVLSLCGALASLPLSATAQTAKRCLIGAYQLENGQTLDIAPSRGDTLHWTAFTGETGRLRPQADGSWTSTVGWTDRPATDTLSSADCKDGEKSEITFGGKRGHRLAFDVSETRFESNGIKLVGRLVLPKGKGPVPVVVLLHGSEDDSARDTNSLQRALPAEGIGVFVYDKRGTGASGGAYTQDFDVLADDAVLAMREARRLAGARAGRVGYQGGSQGGWIAPLAAQRSPVDFVIVGFGLTVSMIDQDQQSVALEMRTNGHSAQDTEKALALTRAGERVIESRGRDGYEAFDALRQKYKSEPWYKDVRGNFLHLVLPLDKAQIVEGLNTKYKFETSFRYDPMPTLRASTTPQLWILAADDRVAPSAESAASIRSLIAAGKRYTLAVYPGADHGMTEFEVNPDGRRVSTRFPKGYFQMMRDFIRDGRVGDAYGNAVMTLPAGGQ